ncbi:uncharacterized protein MKZ38_005280 [Zalerion maritima]|uniref:Uncharacterized protein n=1 Tax=Zalerion maritima TaxID=339359 RepID=A0AAD5WPD1_9PEZI|nr:uncharacterized protein MKZ38_005280 [Zalerion maritima]
MKVSTLFQFVVVCLGAFPVNGQDDFNTTELSCEEALEPFYEYIETNCTKALRDIQTCLPDDKNSETLTTVAGNLIYCLDQYHSVDDGLDFVPKDGSHSGNMIGNGLYLTLFSPLFASSVPRDPSISLDTSDDSCGNPDYLPLFETVLEAFLAEQNCSAEHKEWHSRDWTNVYYEQPGDPYAAVLKMPTQYQRCTVQKPEGGVEECISESIAKLRWVLPDLFIWGGRKKCDSVASLHVSFVFKMIIEVLEVIAAIWWKRRKREKGEFESDKAFSFSRLTFSFLQGFGVEILVAYLLYRDAITGFLPGLFAIMLFTPRPVPFSAGLAGAFLGKSWGTQMLVADGLVGLLASYTISILPLDSEGNFSLAPKPVSGPDVPSRYAILFNGLILTNYPVYILCVMYFILMTILPFMAAVHCCMKRKGHKVGASLKIFVIMLLIVVYPFVVPIMAVAEIISNVRHRGSDYKFGPARWADNLLADISSWKKKVLDVLYWLWCVLHFVIFVGRWMVISNMLAMAGDVFCPSSLTEASAAGPLVTLGLVLANLGLQVTGLSN